MTTTTSGHGNASPTDARARAAGDAAVFRTDLALPGRRQGKVRDVYRTGDAPDAPLLIVATDRISAFDVVMPTPVPGKGRVLTEMSLGWFAFLRAKGIVGGATSGRQARTGHHGDQQGDHHGNHALRERALSDHVLGTDLSSVAGLGASDRAMLAGRSMLCRAAKVVPIECVARGYLAGSGWAEYRASGTVCGVPLPPGLSQCARLPEPIFTPAIKAEEGHDENVSLERASELVGAGLMARLRDLTLSIYGAAAEHALARGVILADTKFEFGFAIGPDGRPTDELMLVDEVLTPDSSRYWPADGYEPGRDQASFDKQYLRNHLLDLVARGRWSKEPPGPELPAEVVSATLARYEEALARLALPRFEPAAVTSPRGGAR